MIADPEDYYISAVTNDLSKLRQIEELPADLDKEAIIKKVELEIKEIVFDMVTFGEISEDTALYILKKEKEFKLILL